MIGLSQAMLFGYRSGKYRATEKALRKLEDAERRLLEASADDPALIEEPPHDPQPGIVRMPAAAISHSIVSAANQLQAATDPTTRAALAAHLQKMAAELETIELQRIAAGHPDAGRCCPERTRYDDSPTEE